MRKIDRTGEKYITNEGYEIEIIEFINTSNCRIKFEDDGIIKTTYENIKKGLIRNPNHITVYNKGYIGYGKYQSSIKGIKNKNYTAWRNMLKRCYSYKFHIIQPTYICCSVVEEWLNFQNFAKWYDENYKEGYELDKDILIKDNKVYGPDTCEYVPSIINGCFKNSNKIRGEYPIGVYKSTDKRNDKYCSKMNNISLGTFDTPEEAFYIYKESKEEYIKQLANKYKDKITKKCYNAMINYGVEITD